jgi:hypothetical protein
MDTDGYFESTDFQIDGFQTNEGRLYLDPIRTLHRHITNSDAVPFPLTFLHCRLQEAIAGGSYL